MGRRRRRLGGGGEAYHNDQITNRLAWSVYIQIGWVTVLLSPTIGKINHGCNQLSIYSGQLSEKLVIFFNTEVVDR